MLNTIKALARPIAKRTIITAGLEVTALIDRAGLMAAARGRGAIFTLHHVRPRPDSAFQPNDILDVTPEFLDLAIRTLAARGYDFIALADLPARLAHATTAPFACFTLDDGYRDNASFAAPVFQRHAVPYTIFLTKGFVEASHSMWWETLDAVLNRADRLEIDLGDGPCRLTAGTQAEKQAAFDRVSRFINKSDESRAVAELDRAARNAGIDPLALTRDLTMRSAEITELARSPLVSFGAHTISHRGLARLSLAEARAEIAQSIDCVGQILGQKPTSFAYPYGDQRSVSARERSLVRELGLTLAVTTRPGVICPDHADDMSALPRISLNGLYQKARYVRALASGIPFRTRA